MTIIDSCFVALAIAAAGTVVLMFLWRNEAHKMRDQRDSAQNSAARLLQRQDEAIDALKDIALRRASDPVKRADVALRHLGLTPWTITEDCPPDRIYFLPKDSGFTMNPTDYL